MALQRAAGNRAVAALGRQLEGRRPSVDSASYPAAVDLSCHGALGKEPGRHEQTQRELARAVRDRRERGHVSVVGERAERRMLARYSWAEFGEDVAAGAVGAVKGIAEPALIVMDFGQMGAALVTHAITDDPEDLEVEFLSATARRIESDPSQAARAGLVLATAIPTGGGSVLVDNVATVFEQNMSPEEAQRFLVRGATGQVVSVAVGMGVSRGTGSGWTGRGTGASDAAMIRNLVDQRVQEGLTGRNPESGNATYAQGRGPTGRLTPVERNVFHDDGTSTHAEPLVDSGLPPAGGRTIVVDQTTCPGCRTDLGGPPSGSQGGGFWDSLVTGSLRVATPRRAGNPTGSPKTAVRAAGRALEQGGPSVELVPSLEFSLPFAPPIVPGYSPEVQR